MTGMRAGSSRDAHTAAINHRSERIRKAFGFSRFQWYVIAPVEYHVRYLLWRLTEGRNA